MAGAMDEEQRQARIGFGCGLGAYLIWGVVPLYFKLLSHVGAFEIVAHRIVWTPALLLLVVAFRRQLREFAMQLANPRILAALAASSLLIAINWLTYIWAVLHDHILAASLGYFLNPLVNVVLGVAVLRERLRRWQVAAVVLAAAGVAILATGALDTLWISLTLGVSFSTYGLIRKVTPVSSLQGLTIETAILFLPSLGWIAWLSTEGGGDFGSDTLTTALLVFGAVVTAVPLMLFASAARRMRLSTLGLLQYIAPTIQFLIGVLVYGEPLGTAQIVCFLCIWAGLVLYTADSLRAQRAARTAPMRPA